MLAGRKLAQCVRTPALELHSLQLAFKGFAFCLDKHDIRLCNSYETYTPRRNRGEENNGRTDESNIWIPLEREKLYNT